MHDWIKKQAAGSKRNDFFEIEGTNLKLPVSLIKGQKDGATLLITAGIHGSEYPGIEAAKQLICELDPQKISGNVVIVPCVNPQAFFERASFINPTDGKNLNRCFPGKRQGTESERLAYALETVFFPMADFYLDFHSGDLPEKLDKFVFVPNFGPSAVVEESHRAAAVLDLPFGVLSKSRNGAYNHACLLGLPSLLIERGSFGERNQQAIAGFIEDAGRMMRHLGMSERPIYQDKKLKLFKDLCFFESPMTGLWTPACEIGDQVKEGQLLGKIENFFGKKLWEYRAEQAGQILYQMVGLPITAGEHLITYGY
ncbi:deacylase [Enterococcus florum]|uniref:Deacylase n=1 Tax=Enterococcus florum TaxID=2480627 RepID=A0A4P5PQ80_9ENTE|nr:M14 family metallopeptidase [Enterococcus florum]GCF95193.1 deacylase [Enterococcus florum]